MHCGERKDETKEMRGDQFVCVSFRFLVGVKRNRKRKKHPENFVEMVERTGTVTFVSEGRFDYNTKKNNLPDETENVITRFVESFPFPSRFIYAYVVLAPLLHLTDSSVSFPFFRVRLR